MRATKKTRVTIETERVWVLEKPGTDKVWCPCCEKLVAPVTPVEVAALLSSARGAKFPLNIDKLHFIGTPESMMVVCADSLLSQSNLP